MVGGVLKNKGKEEWRLPYTTRAKLWATLAHSFALNLSAAWFGLRQCYVYAVIFG